MCRSLKGLVVAKLVIKSLRGSAKSAAGSVGKKVVVSAGKRRTVRTLDANSATFDEGLKYVFSRNVAKARRENKRILGRADIVPPKT